MSSAEEIHITIDGVQVKTQPGKMVLEAAMEGGVYIPYLCYHPGMKPFAACRMCVVEVEGGRGYPASCTLPVQDGMVLKNESPAVYELRRSIMEMLISGASARVPDLPPSGPLWASGHLPASRFG